MYTQYITARFIKVRNGYTRQNDAWNAVKYTIIIYNYGPKETK